MLRYLAQTVTDASILPATRAWERLMPYRLYEWGGARKPGPMTTSGAWRVNGARSCATTWRLPKWRSFRH
eukprot:7402172-Lingulodinium_polyedra.AAC.1